MDRVAYWWGRYGWSSPGTKVLHDSAGVGKEQRQWMRIFSNIHIILHRWRKFFNAFWITNLLLWKMRHYYTLSVMWTSNIWENKKMQKRENILWKIMAQRDHTHGESMLMCVYLCLLDKFKLVLVHYRFIISWIRKTVLLAEIFFALF